MTLRLVGRACPHQHRLLEVNHGRAARRLVDVLGCPRSSRSRAWPGKRYPDSLGRFTHLALIRAALTSA